MVSASIMALQDECGSTDSETTLPMAMENKVPLDIEISSTKSIQLKKESHSGDDHTLKVRKPYTITKQRERWTEDEHKKFLEALKLYGRAWRRIEEHVGTKTAVQIRSHAQKYFSKVVRGSNKEDVGSVEPIEIPPPRPKRKPLHPYPRKSSNSVKSGALALEKPSAPLCLPTEANHSPTSVLSAFCSDAPGTTDSTTRDGSQSPVSSVAGGSGGFILSEPPNLSLPKANTLLSSSQVNNGPNLEEKSTLKLELFPEDKYFVKEGSVEVSSTQCLKLFGQTVLVADSCRSTSPTPEICKMQPANDNDGKLAQTSPTPEICKMQPANDNDGKLAQALPWNFIPINYSQGTLECSWSALPFGTHPTLYCLPLQSERSDATESRLSNSLPWWTHQGVTAFPFVQVHSPIPIKAPFLEDAREMQEREISQDGSSSHSNTESENGEGIRNHEAQSSQWLLGKEEKSLASSRPGETSFLELRASSSERTQGFVPYKRCLADRDARLLVTGEERVEQRIRLCL